MQPLVRQITCPLALFAFATGFLWATPTTAQTSPNIASANPNEYRNFAMRQEGDSLRGRELFFSEQPEVIAAHKKDWETVIAKEAKKQEKRANTP